VGRPDHKPSKRERRQIHRFKNINDPETDGSS